RRHLPRRNRRTHRPQGVYAAGRGLRANSVKFAPRLGGRHNRPADGRVYPSRRDPEHDSWSLSMATVLSPAPLRDVSLDDKYELETGRVFVTGVQALVRLLILQHQRDKLAGLNTAGFVSCYRGSPLGGLDLALWKAANFLERDNIKFRPGLNEDLAATAIWGSQQVNLYPGAKVDGVFAMWYGKGPGVDRCGDVFK